MMAGLAGPAGAQITPAAGYTPPDDTPSIRVGVTLFADYSFTQSPETTDADGNEINASAFNVSRAYINITGNISHIVAFRVTPDVSRETGTGSSLSGSLTFRVKYAYAQFNLDDWMTRGSYARLGIQQTPWLDYAEGIYRYRFQGTMFVEREGYFASADAGASFHYQLPSNFGDVHAGVYNGENYNRAEANDQKATMIRGTVRPFAKSSMVVLRGLRATGFYDADHYLRDGDRTRGIAALNFEHQYVNAGFEYLSASDRTSVTRAGVDSQGYSLWATPKSAKGWEGLLRYDHLTPNDAADNQTRSRTIVGLAYWFPHQGSVSAALMLDYDGQTFDRFEPAQAKQQRIAVHGLVTF
ncbi:MAG: porin [Betaproteobacteria bacterium]